MARAIPATAASAMGMRMGAKNMVVSFLDVNKQLGCLRLAARVDQRSSQSRKSMIARQSELDEWSVIGFS